MVSMGLTAILLIFWPLLYLGHRWSHFTLKETLVLGLVWLLLLGAVLISGESIWWFIVPGALLTVYVIGNVLGWDAQSNHYTDGT